MKLIHQMCFLPLDLRDLLDKMLIYALGIKRSCKYFTTLQSHAEHSNSNILSGKDAKSDNMSRVMSRMHEHLETILIITNAI